MQWLSRLCADKTTLYQTITGFQPSIGRHFVAFHTISTTDPEEPMQLRKLIYTLCNVLGQDT